MRKIKRYIRKFKRKKHSIIKIVPIFVIFILVGVTIAYLRSSSSVDNVFNTGEYGAKVSEVFSSPNDWKPGDVTPKTITAKNTGDICENVRLSYTESWTSENGDPLPLEFETNKRTAIINLDNEGDWIYNNGYYYYQSDLLAGETTTSFLKSVTFNPEYSPTLECTTTSNSQECKSSGDDYDGAEYNLTITVETIQCEATTSQWGVTIPDRVPDGYAYSINTNTVSYGNFASTLGTTYQAPEEAATNFSRNIFLRHNITNNRITSSSVAFIKDDTTYYLQGGGATLDSTTGDYNNDSIYYNTNKQILLTALGSSNCTENTNPDSITCSASGVYAYAYSYGDVYADGGDWNCRVHAGGSSNCGAR